MPELVDGNDLVGIMERLADAHVVEGVSANPTNEQLAQLFAGVEPGALKAVLAILTDMPATFTIEMHTLGVLFYGYHLGIAVARRGAEDV